jgi:UDP-N-acetylglucosamine 1-carboxyvinyltransferase
MDRIRIGSGRPLTGTIHIGGAKNAALPLLAASLLTDETLTLTNLPHVTDIVTLAYLLRQLGVSLTLDGRAPNGGHAGRALSLTADTIVDTTAPYDLVRKMRASVLVLGPLVAREGRARVSLPGGCAIGNRPVDLHLMGLRGLGADIDLVDGYIVAEAPRGLAGAHIHFPRVSMGATENLLMAACLARGETVLSNAAREPEVCDLARCLVAMGASIEGIGTGELRIQGTDRLHGTEHAVAPDRIEAGTYAVAAAITDGDIELVGGGDALTGFVGDKLAEAGVLVEPTRRGVRVRRENGPIIGVDIVTEPHPGFPTDLQAQMMALMTIAEGSATVTETIFENRFTHALELGRMGARITINGASAVIRGVPRLIGAPVMASDLRASASLVLAGLAAEGETIVSRVYHLDRGYEQIEEKLAACGADIERIKD